MPQSPRPGNPGLDPGTLTFLIFPKLVATVRRCPAEEQAPLYGGTVDRDNTLRQISDGLKRIVIRDSKIERITPSEPYRNLERFAISQPLTVHAGAMPKYRRRRRKPNPWDEKGRRKFSYIGERGEGPRS